MIWTKGTAPSARREGRSRVAGVIRSVFAPKPKLTISQWAEKYRWLDEYTAGGARPWGKTPPYLREILDVIGDPRTQEAVIMKSAQVGFTNGILLNIIAYFIHLLPRGLMLVQPSEGAAKKFTKDKLDPTIRATPVLRGLIKEQKRKRGQADNDTLLSKYFRGGFLQMVGAASPIGLRSSSVGVVLVDEVDAMDPRGAGDEGDQIDLARARTETFWDGKVVVGSTPTLTEISRILPRFKASDQRYYHITCPHCGGEQHLEWGDRDSAYGIKFEYTRTATGQRLVKPGSVYYLCKHSACLITEHEKRRAVRTGRWIAQNPESSIAGWHINSLISVLAGAKWEKLVQRWLSAQGDPAALQVFMNTVLGLPWDGPAQKVGPDTLYGRREEYGAGYPVEVPRGVGLLTMAVDTQDRWLEYTVKGWGVEGESWVIEHGQLVGSPSRPKVWRELDALRAREWQHEGGARLRIAAVTIDAMGHHTEDVYKYVKPREEFNVRACRGSTTPGQPLVAKVTRPGKRGVRLVHVGTETAKDTIYAVLNIAEGPGRMHFPMSLDAEYFRQLVAETPVNRLRGGKIIRQYIPPKSGRVEALDLEVLNRLAVRITLGQRYAEKLADQVDAVWAEGLRIRQAEVAGSARPPSVAGPARRGGRKGGRRGGREVSGGVR
jgi:phage terminase large subunit GpA-like protein